MAVAALLCALLACAALAAGPDLAVGPGGHFLVRKSTGQPFFWLSDTAWGLFHLPPKDVEWYLHTRKAQGYTVISTGNIYPNYYRVNYRGDPPFLDNDFMRPNPSFFAYLDWIADAAQGQGMFITFRGLGHAIDRGVAKYYPNEPMHLTRAQARKFSRWLGARWREKSNVILFTGQDKDAFRTDLNPGEPPDQRPWWRAQAEGWAEGVTGARDLHYDIDDPAWRNVVLSWHPAGSRNGSGAPFHHDRWLTFNQNQSWQFKYLYRTIEADWNRNPTKPTFVGEAVYEGSNHGDVDGRVARNIRAQAWVSVLAGGFGYTYGAAGVFFFDGLKDGTDWRTLVRYNVGGRQLVYLKDLIESRPMLERGTAEGFVLRPRRSLDRRVQGSLATSGHYAIVYFPRADQRRTLLIGRLSGHLVRAWWYNPRDGLTYDRRANRTDQPFSQYVVRPGDTASFDPPGSGEQEDWVLVLDDAAQDYGIPGRPATAAGNSFAAEPQRTQR